MNLLAFDWSTFALGAVPAAVLLVTTVIAVIKATKGGKKWHKAILDEKEAFMDVYKQLKPAIQAAKKASDSGQVAHKVLVDNVDPEVLGELDAETKAQLNIAAAPIQDIVNDELAKNNVKDDDKLKTLVKSVNEGATANEAWDKWAKVGGAVVNTAAKVIT